MEEDLSTLMENISFTEEEDNEIPIPLGEFQEVVSYGKNCIVAKLVSDRLISKETIKNSLKRWCKFSGSPSFKVLGENLFLIEFLKMEDKGRVLEGRPWIF